MSKVKSLSCRFLRQCTLIDNINNTIINLSDFTCVFITEAYHITLLLKSFVAFLMLDYIIFLSSLRNADVMRTPYLNFFPT